MNRLIFLVPIVLFAQIEWTEHVIDSTFDGASDVYACDLDEDGNIDVLGAASVADDITWWENDGNGNFIEHVIDSTYDGANSVYACDLDEDGNIDVLGAASVADDITWWENDGNENFTEHTIAGNFNGANSVFACDLDGDNDIDVLGTAYSANDIIWWENADDTGITWIEHPIKTDFNGANSVYACDLDGDSDIDVLGTAGTADIVAWWENDGNENFTMDTIASQFDGPGSVFTCDLDQDGDSDVLGTASIGDEITWFENVDDTAWIEHPIDTAFDGASSVCACDLDQDGDIDVLGEASVADDITWWENDGNENFTEHTINGNFDGAYSVYACDLNGDSHIDVLGTAFLADDIAWWESDLPYDVAPVSIDIPTDIPEDTTLYPRATVKNLGVRTDTFDIYCTIEPGAYSSVTNGCLLAGDSVQVTFPDSFTFVGGAYTVTVWTLLAGDDNPANDTLVKVVVTQGIAEQGSKPEAFMFKVPTVSKDKARILLALASAAKVELLVYDVMGRLAQTLIDKRLSVGIHSLNINLDLPAGVYFYNLKTSSGENVIKKFLLVR